MSQAVTTAKKQEIMQAVSTVTVRNEEILKANGVSKDAFKQVVINAFVKNPGLAACSTQSLVVAVTQAIQANIMPNGVTGALVPQRNNKTGETDCSFWPMTAGLLNAARKALPGTAIQAHSVYDGDEFDVTLGTSPQIIHVPDPNADRTPDHLVAVYALVHHPGNPVPEFEVLYASDIKTFRQASRARGGPWSGPWAAEMAEARALKRVLKRLPVSPDLMSLLAGEEAPVEDDGYGDDDQGEPIPAPVTVEAEAVDITPELEPAPEPKPAPKKAAPKKKASAPKKEPAPEPEPEVPFDDDGDDFGSVSW